MKKKLFIAILFVIAVCMTLTVFASDPIYADLNWTLDDGRLTISGKGSMRNFDYGEYSEKNWKQETIINSTTSIEIAEGITTIGDYAFYGFKNCTSVKLPDTVTRIGKFAFYGCSSLSEVTFSENIDTIDDFAFSNCNLLEKLIIPDNVTSIGSYAFSGCTAIDTLILPSNLGIINYNAFEGCTSLSSITLGNSVTSIGNAAFKSCTSLTSITIPNKVTRIGESAFKGCTSLSSITLGNSVTSIGNAAFKGCTGLTSITIPDSVKYIENFAFEGCISLTQVNLPDSLMSIGEASFQNCKKLKKIIIPSNIVNIPHYCFEGCESLSEVYLNEGLDTIGPKAFYRCTSLKSIVIPSTVEKIHYDSFRECALTSVRVTEGNQRYRSKNDKMIIEDYSELADESEEELGFRIKEMLIYICKGSSIPTDKNVNALAPDLFYERQDLEYINIPDNIEYIGVSAFYRCTNLKSVKLSENLVRIDNEAFACSGIERIDLPGSLRYICNYAFFDTHLTTIIVPPISYIGGEAFGKADSGTLKSVFFIGDLPEWIGDDPIHSISSWIVDKGYEPATIYCVKRLDSKTNSWTESPDYNENTGMFGEDNLDGKTAFANKLVVLNYGNVNNDLDSKGKDVINARDADLAARYVAGFDLSKEVYYPIAMDVDGDHEITPRDVMILSRYVAGWSGYTIPYTK